jgi:hypothetical protein
MYVYFFLFQALASFSSRRLKESNMPRSHLSNLVDRVTLAKLHAVPIYTYPEFIKILNAALNSELSTRSDLPECIYPRLIVEDSNRLYAAATKVYAPLSNENASFPKYHFDAPYGTCAFDIAKLKTFTNKKINGNVDEKQTDNVNENDIRKSTFCEVCNEYVKNMENVSICSKFVFSLIALVSNLYFDIFIFFV